MQIYGKFLKWEKHFDNFLGNTHHIHWITTYNTEQLSSNKPTHVSHWYTELIFVVVTCFCAAEHLVGTDAAAGVVRLDYEVWQREIVDAPNPIRNLTTVVGIVVGNFFLRIVIFIVRKRLNVRTFCATVEDVFEVEAQFKIAIQNLLGDIERAAVSRTRRICAKHLVNSLSLSKFAAEIITTESYKTVFGELN